MTPLFDHEKLNVYQESIAFVGWVELTCREAGKRSGIVDQFERAATSIPLNIAEGNGKPKSLERCRFFDIARGAAMECAACLDVMSVTERISKDKANEGKAKLVRIVSMLVGLVRSNSDRVCEDAPIVEGLHGKRSD
jgi:four helix bundle protein